MALFADNLKKIVGPWILHWYQRYERRISSISLVGGFVFDDLTLTRADQFREGLWIIAHLLAVALCIILINRQETEPEEKAKGPRAHFWLTNVLQFLFGGLLSTYIVFYFRSATLTADWPFMLILVAAFVANDRLRQHRERLMFQVGLFFLSFFAFAIFMVPVLVHKIGPLTFLASGILSLVAIWGFLAVLRTQSKHRFQSDRGSLVAAIAVIFVCFNAMYLLNVVPPLPLSLKEGRIVHNVSKTPTGDYLVNSEDPDGWLEYFNIFTDVHAAPGDSISAWSAVFSPPALNLTIVHEWQFYEARTHHWATKGRIRLPVIGGRDGGFRTYSTKSQPAPGLWRVNIETEQGAVIGRIRFRVVPVTTPVALKTENKT
jgi:DUF2914 family protein